MNNLGQLGIGTSRINQYSPALIQNMINAIDISGSQNAGFIINTCNNGFSGPLCQDPICFGIPSFNIQDVCSGEGVCTETDQCTCYPPSYGSQCENNNVYYWKSPIDGDWSNPLSWSIQKGDLFVNAPNSPGIMNEIIYFNEAGSYNVMLNNNIFNISSITINQNTNLKMTLNNAILSIKDEFQIYGQLNIIGGSVFVNNIMGQVSLQSTILNANQVNFSTSINIYSSYMTVKKASFLGDSITSSNIQIDQIFLSFDSIWTNSIVSITNFSANTLEITSSSINILQGQITNSLISKSCNITGNLLFPFASSISLDSTSFNNVNITSYGNFTTTTSISIDNSMIINAGNFTYNSIMNSLVENSTIINLGNWIHYGNLTSINSLFENLGTVKMVSSYLYFDIQNFNSFELGQNEYYFKSFQQFKGSITLNNSKLYSSDPILINGGLFYASGEIYTPLLNITTSDGFIKLSDQYKLSIIGNLSLSDTSTLFLRISGVNSNQNDFINVTGELTLNSFILLKIINGYSPQIGDKSEFFSFGSLKQSNNDIQMLGAPFKNAELLYNSNSGYFQVILSLGSVDYVGYRCNYLGNQKILEMNDHYSQKKMIISITVPIKNNPIGFGFDLNGTISSSTLALYDLISIQPYIHNPQQTYSSLLDAEITQSTSIFNIGPQYYTITLLVPYNDLQNQKFIYYSEHSRYNFTNQTHYYEKYQFSILFDQVIDCTNFLEPSRAEIYNLPVTIILLSFYLFLFILCFLFRNYRPLNTRGISALFTITFLFVQLLLEIRNYFEIPAYQGTLCVFLGYGIYPLQAVCFAMIYFYFLRYFSIINLNENKKNIYHQSKDGVQATRFQKFKNYFLKIMVSPYLTLILLISSFFILVIINTIILGADIYICRFDTLIAMRSVLNVELIIIYLLTILTLFGDLIFNYDMIINCKLLEYVFYSDPYYFRAQIILYFPLMIFNLAVEIIVSISNVSFLNIVEYHYPVIILNTISFAFLLIIDVLFPLIITIIRFFFTLCDKKEKEGSLEAILQDPTMEAMFIKFCEDEFTIENVLCFQDIQNFKKGKSNPLEIYLKYLNGSNSVMEINIPRKTCQKVFVKLSRSEIESDLFNEIESDVRKNLYDNSILSFKKTQEYKKHVLSKKKEIELIEGKK